jgi:hypothetical protein
LVSGWISPSDSPAGCSTKLLIDIVDFEGEPVVGERMDFSFGLSCGMLNKSVDRYC